MKPVPQFPFQRVATDMFEFFRNQYSLIVDSYSGVKNSSKTMHLSSQSVTDYLKDSLVTNGVPDIIESGKCP